MPFAIKSNLSWRAIAGIDELLADETYSETSPDQNPEYVTAMKWMEVKEFISLTLNSSAWTQLVDSGLSMSKRLEWKAYRDDLRSIQDDFANPDDVVFPTEPTEE